MRLLAILSFWQIRNALRSSLTNPRKLVPALVIGFFVILQLLLALLVGGHRSGLPEPTGEWVRQYLPVVHTLVFAGLALLSVGILHSGFDEGFLTFSLSDIDYLFPAPIHRKAVLAYRLAAKTAVSFVQTAFFFYLVVWQMGRPLGLVGRWDYSILVLIALFCCIGGYVNLAFTLKLLFGFGRLATVRRLLGALVAVILGGLCFAFLRGGTGALATLVNNQVPQILFYPCRVAADAVTGPAFGNSPIAPALLLFLFYGLTLALLFSRSEHFYEATLEGSQRTARLVTAVREQNWSAIFAIQSERRQSLAGKPVRAGRPYAFPPFGQGAVALFWANLAAAAKRPVLNCFGPLALGLAMPQVVAAYADPRLVAVIVGGLCAYLLFLMTAAFFNTHRQAIARVPLVRLLPVHPWKLVAAEASPPVLITSIFTVAAGLSLLLTGVPRGQLVAMLLIVCAPVAIAWMALLNFLVAIWYPNFQDKLQRLIAGFIMMSLMGVTVGYLATLVTVTMFLGLTPWVAGLAFLVPSVPGVLALLAGVSVAYRKYQPAEDG